MNKQPKSNPNQPKASTKHPDRPATPPVAGKEGKRGPSRISKLFTAVGQKLFLVIISAVVVFAAAAAGALITYEVQRDVWEQKLQHEEQQQLVDKRIELMEKTIALMSRSKVVREMDETDRKTTLATVAKVGLDPTKIVDVIGKSLKEKSLARCAVMESRSEYATILRLDAIFFGDKTRKAVEALLDEDPWWNADPRLRENLIAALEDDFFSEGSTD